MTVVTQLLSWYRTHGRHTLPWRQTRDPYSILVSELMLQQTQVPRVIPKYEAFLKKFPTIQHLARAQRKDVLQLWQGLGYNSRAVRLHTLAKLVMEKYNGKLPMTREELLALPGIGPYTAGAVMIFAHDKQSSSTDVNVIRVIKRLFWSKRAWPNTKAVEEQAFAILADMPHDVQSALMDFGSSVCTARTPNCATCPLKSSCKSQGVRPDETVKRQPAFKHSNRWWRGQILKNVLAGSTSESTLRKELGVDNATLDKALQGLLKDGVLRKKNGKLIA